jgi:hypothetical protein
MSARIGVYMPSDKPVTTMTGTARQDRQPASDLHTAAAGMKNPPPAGTGGMAPLCNAHCVVAIPRRAAAYHGDGFGTPPAGSGS